MAETPEPRPRFRSVIPMHRCLVTTEKLLRDQCRLEKEEARHLQTVLRVQAGEVIELFDGRGKTRQAAVRALDRHAITLEAIQPVQAARPHRTAITLFACISKGKRMDWTIEKAVELGAEQIIPVISEHTIVRVAADEREEKARRWQKIADEAGRQCGTAWVPQIALPLTLEETLPLIKASAPVFLGALTPGVKPLREEIGKWANPPARAGWYIGPEGDFTAEEIDTLVAAGALPVNLGPLVLRTETACMYGLAVMNCLFL